MLRRLLRPDSPTAHASICPSCGALTDADPCPECGSPLRPGPSPAALALAAALWFAAVLGIATGVNILRGNSPVLYRESGLLFFLPAALAILITVHWIRKAGGISGIMARMRSAPEVAKISEGEKPRESGIVNIRSASAGEAPRKSGKLIGVALLAIVIGGLIFFIAGPPQPLKPGDISIKSVSFKGIGVSQILTQGIPTDMKLSVVFGVRNPNVVDTSVTQLEYDLFLNDIPAGHGALPNPVLVSANGNADIPTEVSVNLVSGAQGLLSSIKEGGLTAKFQGSVVLKSAVSSLTSTAPFTLQHKVS